MHNINIQYCRYCMFIGCINAERMMYIQKLNNDSLGKYSAMSYNWFQQGKWKEIGSVC
jgi:late competence protein required for DNA uptake (superfamily II DNA/RNA helicase)